MYISDLSKLPNVLNVVSNAVSNVSNIQKLLIEVTFGQKTQIISEEINYFDRLKEVVSKLFCEEMDERPLLDFFYVDSQNDSIEVSNNEEFMTVCSDHRINQSSCTMKILVFNYYESLFNCDETVSVINKPEKNIEEIVQNGQNEDKNSIGHSNFNKPVCMEELFLGISISESIITSKYIPEMQDKKDNNNSSINERKQTENKKSLGLKNLSSSEYLESCIYSDEKVSETKKKEEEIKKDESESVYSIHNNRETEQLNKTVITEKEQEEEIIIAQASKSSQTFTNENLEEEMKNEEFVQTSKQKIENQIENIINNFEIKGTERKEIIPEKEQEEEIIIAQASKSNQTFTEENLKEEMNNEEFVQILKQKIENQIENIIYDFEIKGTERKEIIREKEEEIIIEEINVIYPYEIKISENLSNYYFNEFCSKCKFQLFKNKFLCISCEDLILCSECESSHLQHPLIKINKECEDIASIEKIKKFLTSSKQKELEEMKVTLKIVNHSTIFAMGQRGKKDIELQVHNNSKRSIEEINISAINNNNDSSFKVNSRIISKLEINQKKNIILSFEAPKECGVYEFEIVSNKSDASIKFQVKVVKPFEIDEANADIIFENYEDLIKLPKDKKIEIYNFIINNDIACKLDFMVEILRKYNYDVDEALNELFSKEEA